MRPAPRELAGRFLRGLVQPDVVRLRRLVIARADRFPMNQVMFAGTGAVPSAAALERIADAAVEIFLAAHG
jgi:hypothetical protein